MKYTVVWQLNAEQRLAAIWATAKDRQAIANSANQIDQFLRYEPEVQGESRDAGDRILLINPLGVLFRVEPQDGMVRVLKVWLSYRQPR